MPKLPVCPHCHTIYRYGDVLKLIYSKKQRCYNCKKNFVIRKRKCILLLLAAAAAAVLINVFEIIALNGTSITMLAVTNVVIFAIMFFLIPYFMDFKEEKREDITDNRSKKRR